MNGRVNDIMKATNPILLVDHSRIRRKAVQSPVKSENTSHFGLGLNVEMDATLKFQGRAKELNVVRVK